MSSALRSRHSPKAAQHRGTAMAKVTIEDISHQTGLSRGTVSRALNDRPDISEKTKRRVLDACDKLHYAPSFAARSLATGRNLAVAVLLGDLDSVFAASLLRGILAQAQAAGYAVHVAELGPDPEQQAQAIRRSVTERIDGVLVASVLSGRAAAALRETAEKRTVVACAPIEGVVCDLFMPDHAEAGRLVARHLLRSGNREVLYVHAPGPGACERLTGFEEVCREHGLDPKAAVVELDAEPLAGADGAERITSRLGGIRAIAAADDFLAVGIMGLCWRCGRVPGRDIAIMGQGNAPACVRITPTLSTIDFCGEELGRRAMETALQRLRRARMDAPQTTYVPPLLVERDSTRSLS
jgi:LacI family transcriptional regulator